MRVTLGTALQPEAAWVYIYFCIKLFLFKTPTKNSVRVSPSDLFSWLKRFLKLNSVVALLEWSEHDVMLSKQDRLSTGIKMPGAVPTAVFGGLFQKMIRKERKNSAEEMGTFLSPAWCTGRSLRPSGEKQLFLCLCLHLSVCPSLPLSPCSERMTNRESQRQQTGMS